MKASRGIGPSQERGVAIKDERAQFICAYFYKNSSALNILLYGR